MAVIQIHPNFNAFYYSFYLEGLRQVYGSSHFVLTTRNFPRFHEHSLAFILEECGRAIRIYISAGDGPGINHEGLEWCDTYAKVNIDPSQLPEVHQSKILAIGPSFGLRIWFPLSALRRAIQSFISARNRISNSRQHFANYYRQWRYRQALDTYEPQSSLNDYVFFASSLWKKELESNEARANFIEACQAIPSITFEGGFVPRSDIQAYSHLFISERYTLGQYLKKTQKSTVVFNTPAVQKCHGWKLGEFLCLGKAILSTPLTRQMPAPLEDGVHVHYVENTRESMCNAVERLCKDPQYRRQLEKGARDYFQAYLHPRKVIERITANAWQNTR